MATVKFLMNNGTIAEMPEQNKENFKRLNGARIKMEVIEDERSYEEILEEIEEEDVVVEEVNDTDDRNVRMDELMNSDKDVLLKLANEYATKNGDKLFNGRNGKKTLAEYITKNQ